MRERIDRHDTMHAGLAGQIADEAPMGGRDLFDIAAPVQEQHMALYVGLRHRRRVIDGPSGPWLQLHLDAAAEALRLIRCRPERQLAHIILHGGGGCGAPLDRQEPQQVIDDAALPARRGIAA